MVVAVHFDNVLGKVCGTALDILTICGRSCGYIVAVDLKRIVHTRENSCDGVIGNVNTQHVIDGAESCSDTGLLAIGISICIAVRLANLTATEFLNEVQGTAHCYTGSVSVNALLEAVGGVGGLTQ